MSIGCIYNTLRKQVATQYKEEAVSRLLNEEAKVLHGPNAIFGQDAGERDHHFAMRKNFLTKLCLSELELHARTRTNLNIKHVAEELSLQEMIWHARGDLNSANSARPLNIRRCDIAQGNLNKWTQALDTLLNNRVKEKERTINHYDSSSSSDDDGD